MKKLSLFFFVITFFSSIGNVSSDNIRGGSVMTGNQLLAMCADNSTYKSCMAYILGFLDGTNHSAMLANQNLICIPEGVTPTQLGILVVNYLVKNPKNLHEHVALLVWASLYESYPC